MSGSRLLQPARELFLVADPPHCLPTRQHAARGKAERTDLRIFTDVDWPSQVDAVKAGRGAIDEVHLLRHERAEMAAGRQARQSEIAEAQRPRYALAAAHEELRAP